MQQRKVRKKVIQSASSLSYTMLTKDLVNKCMLGLVARYFCVEKFVSIAAKNEVVISALPLVPGPFFVVFD